MDGLSDESVAEAAVGAAVDSADTADSEERADDEDGDADDSDDDDSSGQSAESDLRQLRDECLTRFGRVAEHFARMREDAGASAAASARDAVREELRAIRFTARTIERLCADIQGMVDDVRVVERQVLQLLVERCGMPRARMSSPASRQRDQSRLGQVAGRRRAPVQQRRGARAA